VDLSSYRPISERRRKISQESNNRPILCALQFYVSLTKYPPNEVKLESSVEFNTINAHFYEVRTIKVLDTYSIHT
jgi:hypothetical protein